MKYNILFLEEGRVGQYEYVSREGIDIRLNRRNKLVRGFQPNSRRIIFEAFVGRSRNCCFSGVILRWYQSNGPEVGLLSGSEKRDAPHGDQSW